MKLTYRHVLECGYESFDLLIRNLVNLALLMKIELKLPETKQNGMN